MLMGLYSLYSSPDGPELEIQSDFQKLIDSGFKIQQNPQLKVVAIGVESPSPVFVVVFIRFLLKNMPLSIYHQIMQEVKKMCKDDGKCLDISFCELALRKSVVDQILADWSKAAQDTIFLLKSSLFYLMCKFLDADRNNKLTEGGELDKSNKPTNPILFSSSSLKNDFFSALRQYFASKLTQSKEKCQSEEKINKKYLVFEGDPMN